MTANILIVDDHAPNLLALEAVLGPLGHRLVRASSGDEALKHLLRDDIALILLDVQMPQLDGFETARLIKAHVRSAGIPIIFMTATSFDAEQVFRGYSFGAVDYLLKPFDPQILRSKVSVFIELHQKSEQIGVQANLLFQRELAIVAQRNEKRYRRLAECLPLSVWAATPDGKVYYSNRVWREYSGHTSEEATTLTNEALVHEDDLARVLTAWAESRKSDTPFEMEYRLRRSDGVYRWQRGRGVAEYDENGKMEGWVVTALDIDDQKSAAEARVRLFALERDARQKADAANGAKDEFLATLSHEIRSPLNAILGWAQLLRKGTLDESGRAQAAETIERNALAQGRLIEDLLDVQRIVSRKTRLALKLVDLRTLIGGAAASARPAAEAKGITLSLELAQVQPFSGDPARLLQIVSNLLLNAVKFTPKNGVVRLELAEVEAGLVITVSDNGAGIRQDFLPHVFEHFQQADSTTTRAHGGLGVGLAIVRHLVELHNGTISAASEGVGKGATFTIRLPVRRSSGQLKAVRPPVVATPPALDGITILVVDDERDARELVRTVLEGCGASVSVASSAEEALQSIRARMPRILVSDIGMPGEDGYSLVEKALAYAAHAGEVRPLAVAVTAFATAADRKHALRVGFDAHVPKPIEPDELVAMIADLVRARFRAPSKVG